MFRSASIKLAVLTPVIFATWYLTSELIHRPRRAEASKTVGQFQSRVVNSETQGPPPLPKGARLVERPVVSSSQLDSETIAVDGPEVTITAKASLMNHNNSTRHLWRLRVYDQNGGMVLDRPYLDQIFKMHESGEMKPSFAERIQLPKGEYKVAITLYSMAEGYNLSHIDVATKPQPGILIHVPSSVVVR
jgi:hypothetical protein